MSFTDHDPWNHLDIRIKLTPANEPLACVECESCGWSSERNLPGSLGGWTLNNQLLDFVDQWHTHLERAHPHVMPKKMCSHVYQPTPDVALRCSLEKNHMTKHAYEWED